MCLNIYRSEEEAKLQGFNNVQFYNDLYFFANTFLSEETSHIIQKIDQATYNTPESFYGIDSVGALDRSYLSTEVKTLLNIVQHTQECFNVIECGDNVLNLLIYLEEGNVVWKNVNLFSFSGFSEELDNKIDIVLDGKRFITVDDFLVYLDQCIRKE